MLSDRIIDTYSPRVMIMSTYMHSFFANSNDIEGAPNNIKVDSIVRVLEKQDVYHIIIYGSVSVSCSI